MPKFSTVLRTKWLRPHHAMSDLLLHTDFKELDYNPMQTSNAMNHQVFWYANLKVWSEHFDKVGLPIMNNEDVWRDPATRISSCA